MAKRLTLLLGVSAVLVGMLPQVAQAATFPVNSTADPGTGGCNATECTLREAIQAANLNPSNSDTITFNIPGPGPHTITPLMALPAVTRNVTIDATTEPDYAGRPVVELNGSLAGSANGLSLAGSGGVGQSVVKGFAINRFRFSGIDVRSSGNIVQANHVGTDITGTLALGNGGGVNVESSANAIGGTAATERNIISGNTGEGLRIAGAAATNNVVQGNYIGTDASGTLPLGNGAGARGVVIIVGSDNLIGGTVAGAGNVISANGVGIWILPSGGNTIQGNYIGTNATGTAPLGNSSEGIIIQQSPNNLVGGTSAAARNVISANGRGVTIQQGGTTGNRVQGNYIGTDATGTNPMGNRDVGVLLAAASGITIGGSAAGAGNVIAFNGTERGGVYVDTGRDNAILANSIFSNGGLGIDLGLLGPTPNDPGDGDTGANQLQNFPVITKAATGGSATTVEGSLNSMPNTTYRIEIFSSPSCDPSGFGEGRTFQTSLNVTTDASGNATLSSGVGAVPEGHVITATATDPAGNTSEFSACGEVRPARATPATLTLSPRAASNPVDTEHTLTATVADAGGAPIPGVVVRFSVTGSVSTSGSCTTNEAGQCDFTYRGPTSPGTDAISAFADTDEDTTQDTGEPGDLASKVWVAAAPNTVVLTPPADTNPVGTQHTVTASVTDAFGNPTSGITVRFTVTGAVTTSGSCTTGASGQCDFTYQGPELPGVDAITAHADTNDNGSPDAGEPQGAAEKTWVLPLSTPLCDVIIGDGGRITANNGDKATFGGNAKVSEAGQASGQQQYTDHGPAQPFNLKSIEILAVTCSADRKEANIYGRATIDGSGDHIFLIQVRDAGKTGKNDTYRILIDNGYDSGVHRLEAGNVSIKAK